MRSWLFVPADSAHKLEKAAKTTADWLILDFEDSVAPARKAIAHEITGAFLNGLKERAAPKIAVRINPLDSNEVEADISAAVAAGAEMIVLPKATHGADIQKLSVLLKVSEAEHGVPEGVTQIVALITESARATLNAGTYAHMSKRLKYLTWGAEDLAADLGVMHNRDDTGQYTDVFRYARSMTILAAAAAGIEALDTVYTDYRDEKGLERECRDALRDGFCGKLAIHPAQVPLINDLFTPSAASVERARTIIERFAAAGESAGVLGLDGRMLDKPHLSHAERTIERANFVHNLTLARQKK